MLDKETIISEYRKYGKIRYESMLKGNYRRGNRAFDKMEKLFYEVAKDKILAKEVFGELLENENVSLRTLIAAKCLILKINEKRAEEVLDEIARNEKDPIFSLDAEMTLKLWRMGELRAKGINS
jgi:hypothetical protein